MLESFQNTDLQAGICSGRANFGRHEGEAMGRPTDLVLDASWPKHKKEKSIKVISLFKSSIGSCYE